MCLPLLPLYRNVQALLEERGRSSHQCVVQSSPPGPHKFRVRMVPRHPVFWSLLAQIRSSPTMPVPHTLNACATPAADAADPVASEDWLGCDEASVSGRVKSHTRYCPRFHGSRVAPSVGSGRFPSLRRRREGSSSACTSTDRIARTRTSLARAWRPCRPALRRQARPWWPSCVTSTPQMQRWDRTRGAPTRRPTAIRSSWLPWRQLA